MLWVFLTPTVVRSSSDQQHLLEREVLRRQDAYGERLQQILFGDDPEMSGHELMQPEGGGTATDAPKPPSGTASAAPAPAPGAGAPADPASAGQWATFVQPTDPADQAVVQQIESTQAPK